MNTTLIVAGFPGVGKTYMVDKHECMSIIDSDSSQFSWDTNGNRNSEFPNNYIQHIKKHMGKVDLILVSTHETVRNALVDNKIPFVLVYPHSSLKDEYMQRFKSRGSEPEFIQLMEGNWDTFLNQLTEQDNCTHLVLDGGEYLSDGSVIERIYNMPAA